MAASSAITSATTKLYYNPGLPATYDTAGYTALTGWVQIAEISNMGAFGGKTTVTKHIPVDSATVVKRAGSVDYGTLNLTLARHSGSDITALQGAFANRTSNAYKVVYPSALAATDYFTAICTSFVTSVGTADKILEATVDLELDSAVIYG